MTLSAEAGELLRQLIELDQGDGILIEEDADIDPAALAELEAAFCVQRHRLTIGEGMHLMLLARARVTSAASTSDTTP